MSIKVKFKKLHPEAKMPTRSSELATGYDLIAISEHFDGTTVVYDTGLAIEYSPEYTAFLAPRSSIANNTTLMLSNSLGIIDPDYRGSLMFKFRNVQTSGAKKYKVGDRIGQIFFLPRIEATFEETTELSETKRGSGGFGSTGK